VSIDVLCVLSKENDFSQFFVNNAFKMFMQVVIPFLKITEKEREDIADDPKEFVNYSIDIC
jgi:hypothetical protein